MNYTKAQVVQILKDNGVDPDVLDRDRIQCLSSPKDYLQLEGDDGDEKRDLTVLERQKIAGQITLNADSARRLVDMLTEGFQLC